MNSFTAVIYKENEIYVAECPEIGSISQGPSIEEALDNLKEATELYLEETHFTSYRHAFITTFNA